jgi:hypothetical protein
MLDRLTAKPELLVRPTSFMVDVEGDQAEVMVASSAHDIIWNIHFVITPAPADPDDWNQKILEAYDRIVSLVQSEAGSHGSPSREFVVGANGANGPPSIVRLMHSELTGSTGVSKLRFLGEFSGAGMIELMLG